MRIKIFLAALSVTAALIFADARAAESPAAFSKTVEALALLYDAHGYQDGGKEIARRLAATKKLVGEPGSFKRIDLINEARGFKVKSR